MDDLEFRRRIFADPHDADQALRSSASSNPTHEKLLDEARALDKRLEDLVHSTPVPEGLRKKLDAAIDSALETTAEAASPVSSLRRYALAACLVVTAGLSLTVFQPGDNPSAAEMALGQQALSHVYDESIAFNGGSPLPLQQVNGIIGEVGAHVNDTGATRALRISFAKPCLVVPPDRSAHLVLESEQGQVTVILSKGSPVTREFSIGDDRYDATIIPVGQDALILVGEKNQNLDRYRELFTDSTNVDWAI